MQIYFKILITPNIWMKLTSLSGNDKGLYATMNGWRIDWFCFRYRRLGLYATMNGWRIDPSSCLDTCWVDDMAVWWFRAACFHGLKYLCVNREVLKHYLLWEQKATNEYLFPTDVLRISIGMGWLSFIL